MVDQNYGIERHTFDILRQNDASSKLQAMKSKLRQMVLYLGINQRERERIYQGQLGEI